MSKDHKRGVEQASAVYKEVIRGYAAENAKLRELVHDMYACISNGAGIDCSACPLDGRDECYFDLRMSRLGIEVE